VKKFFPAGALREALPQPDWRFQLFSSETCASIIGDFGVKMKLNPARLLLEGRRVVLVDGLDTPCRSELIAANNTVEEIRRFVEADSLGYLSMSSLRKAVADDDHRYCYACYTGDYPTDIVQIGELAAAKRRR
jgi:amidophosphoribosyltransferase